MRSKSPSPNTSKKVSRRELIRGTAAATLLAATSLPIPGLAEAAKKAHPAPIPDAEAFPILAAWLAFTTNPEFRALGGSLANSLGVPAKVVEPFAKFDSPNFAEKPPSFNNYASLFNHVRTVFQKCAKDAAYSGPQCPKDIGTLKVIAGLGTSKT